MTNFKDVIAVRDEFAQGNHFGSAEAENAQYLDSISGKLNTLKETWVSILSTFAKSDSIKSVLDLLITLSEAIDSVVKSLDGMGMLLPATFGLMSGGGSLLKGLAGHGESQTFQIRQVGDALQLVQTQSKNTTPHLKNIVKGFKEGDTMAGKFKGGLKAVGDSITSSVIPSLKGMAVAGLKGVAVGLAFKGVGYVLDNTINKYKNLDKELQANVDASKSQVSELKKQKASLEELAEEYDSLSSKTDKNTQEQERFAELRRQIAEISPDLVMGYDEKNDPILKMTGSMGDYIKSIEQAIDKQQTLQRNIEITAGKNAREEWNKGREGYQTGDKDDNALKKQTLDIHQSIKEIQSAKELLSDAMRGGDLDKAMNSSREALAEYSSAISYGYQKVLDAETELAPMLAQARRETIGMLGNQTGYKEATEEVKSSINTLVGAMDVAELSDSDMTAMINSINKSLKQSGDEIPPVVEKYTALRNELEKTHQFEDYEGKVAKIVPEMAKFLGVSEDVVKQLVATPPALKSVTGDLDAFLMQFGKREVMVGFDVEAKNLQETFENIQSTFTEFSNTSNIVNVDGKIQLHPDIVDDALTDISLPEEFRKALGLAKSSEGFVSPEEVSVLTQLLFSYQIMDSEEGYKKLATETQNNMDKLFGRGAVDVDNLKVDVKGKVNNVDVDTSKMEETLKVFGGKEEVKKLFRTEVVGLDKVEHYSNIVKNLPTDSEHIERFIVENSDALSQMNSYKEVKEWILANPEVISTYKLNVDKDPELKQALEDFEKNNGKTSTGTVKVNEEGADETNKKLDETNKKLEETNKQADELSKGINLSVNNGELQGSVESFNKLIEYSSKLKDGEYKLSFTSDTGDSIAQINNLKNAVNDLSSAFSSLPNVTLRIETALASQNVTGLRNNIQKYNDSVGGIKTVTFKTETAKASQNVTGLKNNVGGYIRSYCGKSYSTKFNTQTAQASQNMTGLKRNVSGYVSSYGGKTFTTTFKVVTAYSTSGKPTSASKGTKPGGVSASPEMGNPIPFGAETQARTGDVASVASDVSTISSRAVTQGTPISVTSSNTLDAIKYNIELLKELENRIDMVANSLSNLDAKMENAVGTNKIQYLQQQNELLREQQQLQKELQDKLKQQQAYIKSALSSKGFQFNKDGNLTNYEEKLLAMERESERLEKLAEDASKKSSDYKGDNDKTKEKLDKQAKDAKEKADKYKENLSEVKDLLGEYIDVTTSKLPDAETEWQKLQNEIDKANEEIYNIKKNQAIEHHKNKVEELQNAYDKLADKMSILEGQLEHAYGKDRLDIMQQQIELLEKQKKIQEDLINYLNSTKSSYQKELGNYGFKFDEDGMLTNQAEVLKKFENSKDLEKVKELVEEYIKLQQDELPDATKEWQNLDNAIKDIYMEQLKVAKEIEDKITEAYKKEVEERKKEIEKETKAKLDAIKKQQDAIKKQQEAYNKKRDEEDYEKDYDEQLSKIEELQKRIDLLSKDTSMSGQKKLAELLEQLAEEQKRLDEMEQDKIDKDTNDKFQEEMDKLDKEMDKIEEEADKIIEKLDELVTPENLDKIIKEALSSGSIKTIDGTLVDLKQFLLDYEDKYGDGLSAMGTVIKNDIASDLNTAMNTLKNLEGILGKLNLSSSTRGASRSTFGAGQFSGDVLRGIQSLMTRNTGVIFNEPLIVVEGNVDRNVIDDLRSYGKQLERQITGNILNAMR